MSALFQLAALTGDASASLAARLADSGPIPGVAATVPVGLPSDVLRRRPDVRRAERELAAATADVGAAVAQEYPRFEIIGDLGLDSVYPGQLTTAASRYWNIAPRLTLPLLAGGRLRANAAATEAARDAALEAYRSTVLHAIADAESSLVAFAAERRREADLSGHAASLQSVYALELKRFQAGDASMIEVLTAQRAENAARDQDAASRAQLARDYAALGKALGGGWQAGRQTR
jgi:outer membrane protein TolC